MTGNKKILGSAVAAVLLGIGSFSAVPAQAAPPANLPAGFDPAHHSTDVNDPDPAHHRPYFVCSASTARCTLTPVPGFDLAGKRVAVGSPNTPVNPGPFAGYNPDRAHHSTDVNDPDPAHHQPTLELNKETGQFELRAIPGFDLNGFRIAATEGDTTDGDTEQDGGNGNGNNGNGNGNGGGRTGNNGNGPFFS